MKCIEAQLGSIPHHPTSHSAYLICWVSNLSRIPMLRTITLLASILLVGHLSASDWTPPSKEASSKIRLAIKDSAHVYIHEGLPHHRAKPEILAKELRRKDTATIGSFHFYTPSVAVTHPEILQHILWSSDSILVYRGFMKACGGFHPDFAVEWFDADGSRYYALICFGCGEIVYSDGKSDYLYELEDGPREILRNALIPYSKKRPPMFPREEKQRHRSSRTGKISPLTH